CEPCRLCRVPGSVGGSTKTPAASSPEVTQSTSEDLSSPDWAIDANAGNSGRCERHASPGTPAASVCNPSAARRGREASCVRSGGGTGSEGQGSTVSYTTDLCVGMASTDSS